MAAEILVIRRDQSEAIRSGEFAALVEGLRAAYFGLQKTKVLMRSMFDDANPEAIDWAALQTLYGVPAGVSGQVFWDLVNGSIMLVESNGLNNDLYKLITRVV